MNIIGLIILLTVILVGIKIETFGEFDEKKTGNYRDWLCSLRKKEKEIACSSIVNVNQRFLNMNPGKLEEKVFKNF